MRLIQTIVATLLSVALTARAQTDDSVTANMVAKPCPTNTFCRLGSNCDTFFTFSNCVWVLVSDNIVTNKDGSICTSVWPQTCPTTCLQTNSDGIPYPCCNQTKSLDCDATSFTTDICITNPSWLPPFVPPVSPLPVKPPDPRVQPELSVSSVSSLMRSALCHTNALFNQGVGCATYYSPSNCVWYQITGVTAFSTDSAGNTIFCTTQYPCPTTCLVTNSDGDILPCCVNMPTDCNASDWIPICITNPLTLPVPLPPPVQPPHKRFFDY